MDRKKIIGEVAARHGVRLDEDDPAMVMATIAEIAFHDAQAELVAAIRAETAQFVRASGEVQERAGAQFGAALRKAIECTSGRAPSRSSVYFAAAAFMASGFVLGWWFSQ
jgi:hypothetical protein